MSTISLRDAAKHYQQLSHQLAAWDWLQGQLSGEQLEEFAELYRADPKAKAPLPPAWVKPALQSIREFEGCRLEAYPDPGTGGTPWTIGWGTTRLMDAPVRMGDVITQAMADELLANEVEHLFGPGVLELLPMAKGWKAEQVAALVSFAYNVGLGALEESTLRKRLLAGEDTNKVVREELPKWCHAGEAVLPGLERRRAAEVALFTEAPRLQAPAQQGPLKGNPLKVPYYSQRDSAVSGQAERMCFSSSCAMLTAFLRPGSIGGPNADDQYLKRVQQYGDTTDANAQIKALASYGITARFVQSADWADLERQISRGVPVPCGFLHHGPSTAPTGGGHWLTVIGFTPTAAIVNDPWGEMLVAQGTYTSSRGAGLAYSRKNWGPRWLVEGPRSGWAIIAEP
jgi:GH24 family phage-related lysozyme (muramidase)